MTVKQPDLPLEGWPSGQWQQTVNLPTNVYVGSNPTPSTIGLTWRSISDRRVGDHELWDVFMKFGVTPARAPLRNVTRTAIKRAGIAQW